MPVYNHFYPDSRNLINTPESSQRLLLEGPRIPVAVGLTETHINVLTRLGMPVPPPVVGEALMDTGATFCAVDQSIIQQLGIPPYGYQRVAGATGLSIQPTYPASLSFPGTPLPNVTFADFIGAPLGPLGIIALIGRNVLAKFVLIYNGPGGYMSLAY